jgi:hypothetical protein
VTRERRGKVRGGVALLVGAVLVSGSVAAAHTRSANQQQAASNYIEKAVLPAINGPACVREHAPATNPGAPPTALTAILGVLRGPPAAADPRTAPILRHLVGVYINYVRLARTTLESRGSCSWRTEARASSPRPT